MDDFIVGLGDETVFLKQTIALGTGISRMIRATDTKLHLHPFMTFTDLQDAIRGKERPVTFQTAMDLIPASVWSQFALFYSDYIVVFPK